MVHLWGRLSGARARTVLSQNHPSAFDKRELGDNAINLTIQEQRLLHMVEIIRCSGKDDGG